MSDIDPALGLLTDAFGRIQEGVVALTDGLSDEVAWYRPDPGANTIAWTLWHLARVVDDHVSDAAGSAPVWPGWRERFGLPFEDDATGYGQTAEQVGQVRVPADRLAERRDDAWHSPTAADR